MEELIQKAGLSKADSAKALQMLKSGKINMGQIASKLNQTTINSIADPHERLKATMRQKKLERGTKEAKDQDYEKMRERVLKEKEDKAVAAVEEAKKAAAKKRNHKKKLKELEAKYGTITDEVYQNAMNKLKPAPEGQVESGKNVESGKTDELNHYKNIIELYAKQNQFKSSIDFNDLDDI